MLTDLVRGLAGIRFVRFLVVGGGNTLFSYLVFSAALYMGAHYSLASLISLLLGILFSFKTTAALVFQDKTRGLFLRYLLVWGVVYGMNTGCLWGFDKAHISLYLANALLVLPTAMTAYFLNKIFVFRAANEGAS